MADHERTLAAIRNKSDLIVNQQQIADAGKFQSIGAALGLQRLRRERAALQAQLPPLRLAALDGEIL